MILLIGYGNELRGDDAVGLRVAEAVERLRLPEVRVLAVPQLTPELAELLAESATAIFIDAAVDGPPGRVDVAPCGPVDLLQPIGHLSDPPSLLALADAVFGSSPSAWLVKVQIENLQMGQGLSAAAQHGVSAAVQVISKLVAQLPSEPGRAGAGHDHEPRSADGPRTTEADG